MERERDIFQENKDYVANMDKTKTLLLDLFLSKELSEKDFKKMMDDLQEWYKQFIKDFKKKPINEDQLEIPFTQ